ncbi:MAG: glycosyltransferase family 2 protein [Betaproteobacteria bacterium]
MFAFENVALIGVTHNSASLANHFAQTARLFRFVWVVDNASQDSTVSAFQRAIPHSQIMALSENIGFGPANNRGFKASLAHCSKAMFMNPDCQINEGSIRLLIQTMDADASVAIASPVVFSDVTQGATLQFRDYTRGYSKIPVTSLSDSCALPEVIVEACLDGACFAVDSTKFQTIGAFDENIFMYSEEDDISLRLSRHGMKKVTLRDAHAQHMGGASSGKSLRLSLRKRYHYRWSGIYMAHKYLGARQGFLLAAKTIIIFPVAMAFYTITFNKRQLLKWTAWFMAACDGLFLTKAFGKLV